ncbi:MAG: cytochrome P450 [Synechococcales bacterium]|nr:cytochrome P450 [Synechococcales bacterium]
MTQPVPVSNVPLLAQMLRWILDPTGFLETSFRQHGDLFRADVAFGDVKPLVFVNHPEAIQTILTQDNGRTFTAPGEANEIAKPLLGANSMILLSGEAHRQRRQLVMPPFHGDRLTAYGEIIRGIAQTVLQEWVTRPQVDVRNAMQQITMRVILQAVFGLYAGDRYHQLEELLRLRLDAVGNPLSSLVIFFAPLQRDWGPWSPGHRIQRIAQKIDDLIFAEIGDRRQAPDPSRTDILSLLLAAHDESGNGLTDQELRDELMTLLIAGHETTATALTWAFYWLHRQPEIKHRLLAELDSVDLSDLNTLLRLPYLTAVCNETLRINPVAMLTFPRQVQEPMELMGYELEPGTLLMGCIYLVHQREDLYPNPRVFNPDRFLERQYSPYEFMPFGGGVRRCVGAALAQYEMKIVLATVLSQYEFELVNRKPIQPQRRGLTLGPSDKVWLRPLGVRQERESAQMAGVS